MRTRRSLGATISSTPLFLSFCPICQWRPSSTPKSSIEVPCSDLSVTTTNWSVVLASNSASFWVSAERVPSSSMPASSTTRPLSAGKSSASAGRTSRNATKAKSARRARLLTALPRRKTMRNPSEPESRGGKSTPGSGGACGATRRSPAALIARVARSEFYLRRRLHVLRHRERLHRLVVLVESRGPDDARERTQLGIVLPHRLDVVAACDHNAILRALELRLQGKEVLVRFKVGISLRNRKQPPERAGELRLRLLEALECFRIVDDIWRNLHLDLGRARPRVGHFLEHLALLRGVAFHRLDQIGNEIGAALILVEHIRPLRFGRFVIAGNVVDAAACEQKAETRDQYGNTSKAQHARCVAHDSPPIPTFMHSTTPAAATAYSQPAQSKAATLALGSDALASAVARHYSDAGADVRAGRNFGPAGLEASPSGLKRRRWSTR